MLRLITLMLMIVKLLMDGRCMKIKKVILALSLLSTISFASIDDAKEERMKILSGLGLPLPGSGIKIVPRSMLTMSDEALQKGLKDKKQMEDKGFVEEDTTRPVELLHFISHADLEFKQYANDHRDYSSHIRHTAEELKLGFTYKPIDKSLITSTIGFVPQGAFHANDGGWSGVVQFFEKKDIGICAYAKINVKVSQTAAQLAMEDVVYTINEKPTLIDTRGNNNSGFVYKIQWFDNENYHELECANMNYSKEMNDSIIALANQIDAYN